MIRPGAWGLWLRRGAGDWRGLALPAGVLAVHQLRYLLAYGPRAGTELRAHGDRYVGSAALLCGLLLAVALLSVAARALSVVRDEGSCGGPSRRSPWRTWLVLAGVLMVGFCLLEAAEMLFAPERAAGLAEVFGGGGWWAAPAALFVSALVTAITCGGRRLLIVLACRSTRRPSRPANAPRRTHRMQIAVASPLATRAAGRAPPYRRRAALAERTQAA